MINEHLLSEKLKYLIEMNLKSSQFKLMSLFIEYEFVGAHESINSYDIDLEFDYEGVLDSEVTELTHDIQRMAYNLRDIISEYVITEDGKIVNKDYSNCYPSEANIWSIKFNYDENHVFRMSYRFHYRE